MIEALCKPLSRVTRRRGKILLPSYPRLFLLPLGGGERTLRCYFYSSRKIKAVPIANSDSHEYFIAMISRPLSFHSETPRNMPHALKYTRTDKYVHFLHGNILRWCLVKEKYETRQSLFESLFISIVENLFRAFYFIYSILIINPVQQILNNKIIQLYQNHKILINNQSVINDKLWIISFVL